MKLHTWEDIQPEAHLKVLIWGAPGAGKTTLAGTFPGIALADCDRGIKVLRSPRFLEAHGRPDLICYREFDDPVDKHGLFKSAKAFWEVFDFYNAVFEMEDVETIVLDSMTTFQNLAMRVGLELSGQAKRSQTLANTRGGRKVALPTQADFGSEMAAFQQFMDQAITLEKNLVFIAHEREQFAGDAIARREPYLIGSSIRGMVGKWFDEVWYLDVKPNGKRVLLTESTNIITGLKSRALSVPNKIENPDYATIINAAEARRKEIESSL